ncbi:MAG: hypothetical protein EAZ95_04670 [Bacteroidetes bacterium]|nr:MAG: hypothetical protein EAZ95_04670 [Bacteroidota bacterium]
MSLDFESITFQYQDGKLNKIIYPEGEYETFEYNSAGKIIKHSIYDVSNALAGYQTFVHVSNTLITFEQFTRANSGSNLEQDVANGRFEFDANGNLTKFQYADDAYYRSEYASNGNATKTYHKVGNSPEYLFVEYSEYDDKKNPFYENFGMKLFLASDNIHLALGKNNLRKYKQYLSDGSLMFSENIDYQYNNQGYPTSTTSDGETYAMTYDCQ